MQCIVSCVEKEVFSPHTVSEAVGGFDLAVFVNDTIGKGDALAPYYGIVMMSQDMKNLPTNCPYEHLSAEFVVQPSNMGLIAHFARHSCNIATLNLFVSNSLTDSFCGFW